jgi:tRNA(Ile)-lysidine synthase
VGFSGGLDSTVLLHWLKQNLPNGCTLQAIHIHHGLNPAADVWAEHCRKMCDSLAIFMHIAHIQIADHSRNIEAQAREARYAAFTRVLSAGDTLALAQHADDVAETLLLRLMRGAGTEALGNMQGHSQYHKIHLWRPLLAMSRSALHAYAQAHDLRWVEDSSNSDTRFDRNFLRNDILPQLAQRFPNVRQRLAHSAALLHADAALLQPVIATHLACCKDNQGLLLRELLMQAAEMQAHILRAWLREKGQPPPGAHALREFLRQLQTHAADANTCLSQPDYRLALWNAGYQCPSKQHRSDTRYPLAWRCPACTAARWTSGLARPGTALTAHPLSSGG